MEVCITDTNAERPDADTENTGRIGFWRMTTVLGVIFYWASLAKRELAYYPSLASASVVKSGQASDLKVYFEDKQIDSDISATQIAIWNNGNLPIKADHILQPIVVFTSSGKQILEAKMMKQTRDVTHLALNKDELQKGRLGINWSILEQNDGCVVQVIYLDDGNTNLNIEGIIEGQRGIAKPDMSAKAGLHKLQHRYPPTDSKFIIAVAVIWAILCAVVAYKRRLRQRNKEDFIVELLWMSGMAILGAIAYFAIMGFTRSNIFPPFGFE